MSGWPGEPPDGPPPGFPPGLNGLGFPVAAGGRPVGRVVLRVAHPAVDGEAPGQVVGSMNMRLDTFFSSGIQVLEQLLSLRGRLQTLGELQQDLNQMIFDHVVQMSLRDQGPQGPPPVEHDDLQRLPEIEITRYHLREDANQKCTICLDAFSEGGTAKQLPCGHIFCVGCVDEWLKQHRTCPVCRKEVKDLEEPTWDRGRCGFQQLRKKECFLTGPQPLVVLAGCSHGFHRACLKRHLGPKLKEKTPSVKVDCPLCKVPSTVLLSDLQGSSHPWPGTGSRPASAACCSSSSDDCTLDEPTVPANPASISIRDMLRNKRANDAKRSANERPRIVPVPPPSAPSTYHTGTQARTTTPGTQRRSASRAGPRPGRRGPQ
eukprot:TRINITY_DN28479_c0_g1_i1.p1 TRINITY_DN28479_c0_g1~~TRINITY_DN28479_c0_g1_i1.p1  ORF type:complete len:375 (+),score=69.02 TRINITY_DN28479_c0_g1_i1:91-1215(+)